MKRSLAAVLLAALLASSVSAQTLGNTTGQGPFVAGGAYGYNQFLGPFFQQPFFSFSPNSLTVTWTAGNIYVGGGSVPVAAGSVALTASQNSCTRPAQSSCNFIYANSSGTVAATTTYLTAVANGNTLLATATTSSSGVTSLQAPYQDVEGLINVQTSDGYFFVPPGSCALNLSGGTLTGTNGLQIVGTSFTPVNLLATTTATETTTITCLITFNSRTTASKGMQVNDITLLYGNSVGATATCNAPTVSTITLPTAGAAETASTVAPVAVAGTLTVTPVVGSCNTTAVTAGQFYTEKVALNTAYAVSTDLTALLFQQSFVGPAAASYTLYTGGLIVHIANTPF